MCGRFALTHSFEEMVDWYNLIVPANNNEMTPPPRYNIAPTQPIMMIDNGQKGRQHMLVRWGLMPGWVKEPDNFTLLINARSETSAEKPSFRNAMRHRRMLVPVSGFYEWRRTGRKSQPYWVRPRDGGLMTIGGLMETWAGSDGTEIDTGCLLTTHANESFSKIHHRLPVILRPRDFDQWLDCMNNEPRHVADLMQPVDDDYLEAIPVSDLVNKVANSGVEIQSPVELPCEAAAVEDQVKSKKKRPLKKADDDQLSMF